MSDTYEKTSSQRIKLPDNNGELPTINNKVNGQSKTYFVKHSKQEMHNYNHELVECNGWDEGDMIYEDNWKGEYHEVMFGPFDKTKAESIFEKIKNIKEFTLFCDTG